jgi:hypothetical protein
LRALSSLVDLLTVIEDQLRESGDGPNARRAQLARHFVLAIACGASREEQVS